MLIINDDDVCPICGAYYQDNDYCCNGHLRMVEKKNKENKIKKKHVYASVVLYILEILAFVYILAGLI